MSTRDGQRARRKVVRLAVVSDAVHPWNTGGKEVRHHELLTRLARNGFQVTIYTMKWWDGARTTTVDGVRFVAICPRMALYAGGRRSIVQALVFALCTLRLLTKRFDVVEVDSIPFLPLFPMRLVATCRRVPMVVTWHEYWGRAYWRQYLGFVGGLASWIELLAARLPTTIVAASQGTGDRLRADTRSGDVRVVPNGVDRREMAVRIPQQRRPVDPGGDHGGSSGELIVVGRLLDHKRVDIALGALQVLRSRGRRVSLRVVGEGPERERLEELASSMSLDEAASFEDFLPARDSLLSAIAGSDVMLFPTVREGFGMVALEALSLGTPVVTSDAADNFARHLLVSGVNGEVCGSRAVEVADAVERVLRERDRYSSAASASVEEYDWDVLARSLGEVYAQ